MDLSPFFAQVRRINLGGPIHVGQPAEVEPQCDGRDLCPNGHEYTATNTATLNNGHRRCRACAAQRQRRWRRNRST